MLSQFLSFSQRKNITLIIWPDLLVAANRSCENPSALPPLIIFRKLFGRPPLETLKPFLIVRIYFFFRGKFSFSCKLSMCKKFDGKGKSEIADSNVNEDPAWFISSETDPKSLSFIFFPPLCHADREESIKSNCIMNNFWRRIEFIF